LHWLFQELAQQKPLPVITTTIPAFAIFCVHLHHILISAELCHGIHAANLSQLAPRKLLRNVWETPYIGLILAETSKH
jgi:hypothetical protein